jgi:hypothetical protein
MPLDQEAFKFPDEKKQEEKPDEIQFEIEGEGVPEVEVVDDTPPEDRGRAPMKEPPAEVTDEELAQYSDGVKKRIQHFSKGYHEERRAKEAAFREREEAVRLAQQLMEENKKLQSSQGQTQQVLLEQAKKVVENELTDAKRRLKEAYEAGDSDKMLEAQEALTAAKIRADRVNNFKPAPLQQEKPAVQPAPQPVQQEQVRVDPKAAAWQEANTWFGTDDEMTALALTVHRKLVESGVSPNSDEYYDRINTRMRQVFPDAFPSEKTEKPVRKSTVVAPATRSTAPKKIVLTQSQVNIAKRLGLTNEQYARAVAEEMRKQNG